MCYLDNVQSTNDLRSSSYQPLCRSPGCHCFLFINRCFPQSFSSLPWVNHYFSCIFPRVSRVYPGASRVFLEYSHVFLWYFPVFRCLWGPFLRGSTYVACFMERDFYGEMFYGDVFKVRPFLGGTLSCWDVFLVRHFLGGTFSCETFSS